MMAVSCIEKFKGRKFNLPSIGREKGMTNQQRSFRPKIKRSKNPIPNKKRTGSLFPPKICTVNHGARTKNPMTMSAMTNFCAVKFCTGLFYAHKTRNAKNVCALLGGGSDPQHIHLYRTAMDVMQAGINIVQNKPTLIL